jgi:hypothetical protein
MHECCPGQQWNTKKTGHGAIGPSAFGPAIRRDCASIPPCADTRVRNPANFVLFCRSAGRNPFLTPDAAANPAARDAVICLARIAISRCNVSRNRQKRTNLFVGSDLSKARFFIKNCMPWTLEHGANCRWTPCCLAAGSSHRIILGLFGAFSSRRHNCPSTSFPGFTTLENHRDPSHAVPERRFLCRRQRQRTRQSRH